MTPATRIHFCFREQRTFPEHQNGLYILLQGDNDNNKLGSAIAPIMTEMGFRKGDIAGVADLASVGMWLSNKLMEPRGLTAVSVRAAFEATMREAIAVSLEFEVCDESYIESEAPRLYGLARA